MIDGKQGLQEISYYRTHILMEEVPVIALMSDSGLLPTGPIVISYRLFQLFSNCCFWDRHWDTSD